MATKDEQNAKNRLAYANKRIAIVSGLGAYATYKDRSVEQWLLDTLPAREYMKRLPR